MNTSGRGVMISPARWSVISKMLWMSSFSPGSSVPVSSPASTNARRSASEITSRVSGRLRSPIRKRIPPATRSRTNRAGATRRAKAASGAEAKREKAFARGQTRHFGVTSPRSRIPSVPAARAAASPYTAGRRGSRSAARTEEIATLTISLPRKIVEMSRLGAESIRSIRAARRSPASIIRSRSTRRRAKRAVSVAEKKAERRNRKGRRRTFTAASAPAARREMRKPPRERRPFEDGAVRPAHADSRSRRHLPDGRRRRRESAGGPDESTAAARADRHHQFVILAAREERGKRVDPQGAGPPAEGRGHRERLLPEGRPEAVALEEVGQVLQDPVAQVDHRRHRAGTRRGNPLPPACLRPKVPPHRLPAPPRRPRGSPAPQEPQSQVRPAGGPGDVEGVPRARAGTGHRPAAHRSADHGQAEDEPVAAAGVPAPQPHPGRARRVRHPPEDPVDRRHGGVPRGRQRRKVADGRRAHRREIGEIG